MILQVTQLHGTPVFVATSTDARLMHVYGATKFDYDPRWYFPAFYPCYRPVLDDLRKLKINVELSEAAQRAVEYLDGVAAKIATRELPAGFEFKTQPFEHQTEGLVHLIHYFRAGLFYGCGLGKSKLVIDWHRATQCWPLVLCPKVVLHVWAHELEKHGIQQEFAIIDATSKAEKTRQITDSKNYQGAVITYDSARLYYEDLATLPYNAIVADECFIGGTLVDTPEGPQPIENLIVNDPIDGITEDQRVQAVNVRYVHQLVRITLESGICFVCTLEHPFFTLQGWVFACQLNQTHYIIHTNYAQELFHGKNMCLVRSKISASKSNSAFLRSILLSEMAYASAGGACASLHSCEICKNRRSFAPSAPPQTRISHTIFYPYDSQKPYERCRNTSESIEHVTADGASTASTQRQRHRAYASRIQTTDVSGSRVEFCNQDPRKSRIGLPHVLQSRHCVPENSFGNRSRRTQPQGIGTSSARPEKRSQTESTRVVHVEILQQKDLEQLGGGEKGIAVYNLRAYPHPSYSVMGHLVHNCHAIKSPSSQRTKTALILSKKASRRIIMSGTPSLGDPRDMYSQLEFLGSFFVPENFWKFQYTFCSFSPRNKHIVTGFKNLDVLRDRVMFTSLQKKKEDCLDLPERHIIDVPVPLVGAQMRLYNTLIRSKEMEEAVESLLFHGPGEVNVPNSAVLINKLLQVVCGFVYKSVEEKGICNGCPELRSCSEENIQPYTSACKKESKPLEPVVEYFAENAKRDMLLQKLEEILEDPNNKVIIWGQFSAELTLIEEALHSHDTKAKTNWGYVRVDGSNTSSIAKAEKRFNEDPLCRVYLGQVETGVGITLNAANYMIYYSLPWKLVAYHQSLDRNHRVGQTQSVTVYRLLAEQSVDMGVKHALDTKMTVAATLTTALLCPHCISKKCGGDTSKQFSKECQYARSIARPITKAKYMVSKHRGIEE